MNKYSYKKLQDFIKDKYNVCQTLSDECNHDNKSVKGM